MYRCESKTLWSDGLEVSLHTPSLRNHKRIVQETWSGSLRPSYGAKVFNPCINY